MSSNSKTRKYKALILDVDGTIIDGQFAVPSQKVRSAIAKASKKIHVGLATSRPVFYLKNILDNLDLSGPSIISGGCQIVDFPSKKILWEKLISFEDAKKVHKILKKFKIEILILDANKGVGKTNVKFSEKNPPKRPLHLWIHKIKPELAEEIITEISHISSIASYRVNSWDKRYEDIVITHAEATKQHGILEISKILGISTHEIIAVGDGYNDFPLLMASGLKVAMGNSVPDLKEIADYVAPSVLDDGVADVIERFVLS